MMKLSPIFLAAALSASAAWGAIDFFGLPDKIVVPKSVAATPAPVTPAPATPSPVATPLPLPPPSFIPDSGETPVRPVKPEFVKPTPAPIRHEEELAPPPAGSVQVFACAQDQYTLFLNGREILSGADGYEVQSGVFPIVKGDVLAAVVQDTGSGKLWFSLRVVRDGTTILDAGDMRYLPTAPPSWKVSKLLSDFRLPTIKTHTKRMGTDNRPRVSSAAVRDVGATTLYFKGIVP